ncbi:MAG: GIY-YIG nuclease family protein [Halofilum sp. (in: g-proteobacteria)]
MAEWSSETTGDAGVIPLTYRLFIRVPRRVVIEPGRLGRHVLARGWYVYTGSARRNMAARLRHHLAGSDVRHWHIDWLLGAGLGRVMHIRLDTESECIVNARRDGRVVIPRFGATDCRHRCGSHLLWLGTRRPLAVPRYPGRRRTHAAIRTLERSGYVA